MPDGSRRALSTSPARRTRTSRSRPASSDASTEDRRLMDRNGSALPPPGADRSLSDDLMVAFQLADVADQIHALADRHDLFERSGLAIHEEEGPVLEGNGGLDLEEVLREQVLLALPMQRVCDAACKGICPVCGRNRNEVDCGCSVAAVDDRWKALRNFQN